MLNSRSLTVTTLLLAISACRHESPPDLPVDPPAVRGGTLEREAIRIAGEGARNCGNSFTRPLFELRQCGAASLAAGEPFYCIASIPVDDSAACRIPRPDETRAYAGNRGGEVFEIHVGWGFGEGPWEVERVLVGGRHVGDPLTSMPAATKPEPLPGFLPTLAGEHLPDGWYLAEIVVSPEGEVQSVKILQSPSPDSGERARHRITSSTFVPARLFGVPVPMLNWPGFSVTNGVVALR